jgi:hypothetical protein
MLKFKVEENEYVVDFEHEGINFAGEWLPDKTVCTITKNGNLAAKGIAICGPNDIFSKDTGRKIALSRALSLFNKKFRYVVWDKYGKASPKSKVKVDEAKVNV